MMVDEDPEQCWSDLDLEEEPTLSPMTVANDVREPESVSVPETPSRVASSPTPSRRNTHAHADKHASTSASRDKVADSPSAMFEPFMLDGGRSMPPLADHTISREWTTAYQDWKDENGVTDEMLRDERSGALAYVESFIGPCQDTFADNHGLIIPDHVFTFVAFLQSLPYVGLALLGVEFVFDVHEQSQPEKGNGVPSATKSSTVTSSSPSSPTASLMQWRAQQDPPEFLPVLVGFADNVVTKFGLWYDDPGKPPSFMAYYGSDDNQISCDGSRTLLEQLRMLVERHHSAYLDKEGMEETLFQLNLLREHLVCFETSQRVERGDAYIQKYTKILRGRLPTADGIGAWIPGLRVTDETSKREELTNGITHAYLDCYSNDYKVKLAKQVSRMREVFGIPTTYFTRAGTTKEKAHIDAPRDCEGDDADESVELLSKEVQSSAGGGAVVGHKSNNGSSSEKAATDISPFDAVYLRRHLVCIIPALVFCITIACLKPMSLIGFFFLFILSSASAYVSVAIVLTSDQSIQEKEQQMFCEKWTNHAIRLANEGKPDLALVLGRNLRWISAGRNNELYQLSNTFLVSAYRSTGRMAFLRLLKLSSLQDQK